ncbi:helix-turn-helix domain-containing protein [Chromobacterium violaceum]|uniref:helix-turn-helix domain-containing protein n=1 Tax=Chromobacterium violaceum TaxID=536 RepID=UPI00069ABE62|nr:helix-turn-helix domain-containing protein [Chromobacterium violaceum]
MTSVGMQGKIDSSFTTEQRDLFASGLVAEIGVNAYAVWSSIKFYADYSSGLAFPGMRTIGEKLGLGKSTVQRAVETLVGAKMLRVVRSASKRRGQTYIARERLSVRIGQQVLCTIVIDYVPNKLRNQLHRIEEALKAGEQDSEAFAEVEIIPGPGFIWDSDSRVLRGKVAAKELPPAPRDDDVMQRIGAAVLSKLAPNLTEKLTKK